MLNKRLVLNSDDGIYFIEFDGEIILYGSKDFLEKIIVVLDEFLNDCPNATYEDFSSILLDSLYSFE